MIVERILRAARKRLIAIGDDALLIAATRLLRDLDVDLVVMHDRDECWPGLSPKPTSSARSVIARELRAWQQRRLS